MYCASSPLKARPGLGLEAADHLHRLHDLLDRDLEVLGDGLVVLRLEVLQVPLDDRHDLGRVGVDVARLQQQALAQVARADAERVEELDCAAPARRLDADARLEGHAHHRVAQRALLASPSTVGIEVAVVVEVPDDEQGDPLLLVREVGEAELPDQVVERSALRVSVASYPGISSSTSPGSTARCGPAAGSGRGTGPSRSRSRPPRPSPPAAFSGLLVLGLGLDVGRLGRAVAVRDRAPPPCSSAPSSSGFSVISVRTGRPAPCARAAGA